jgi:hypothetical protein
MSWGGVERSARIPAEVGCSPRLAGEARPGFCRECNRRRPAQPHDHAAAGCAPGRSLVASGARRGGQPTEPPPPNRQPAARQTTCFPEPGPPEAQLTLISLRQDNRQEPTARQVKTTARVEDFGVYGKPAPPSTGMKQAYQPAATARMAISSHTIHWCLTLASHPAGASRIGKAASISRGTTL